MTFGSDLDGFNIAWVDDQVVGAADQGVVDTDPEFAVSRRNALEIEEFRQAHHLHLLFSDTSPVLPLYPHRTSSLL